MFRCLAALLVFLFAAAAPCRAEDSLPPVDDVSWAELRKQVGALLPDLRRQSSPLSQQSLKRLESLLEGKPRGEEQAAAAVQRLLDAHCLVGVSINPESRVKAVRGPAAARLRQGQETLILVKVSNEAGVTHPLSVSSAQLVQGDKKDRERWLEARVMSPARLSGGRLDYCVLALKPHQAGKREATLQFDVGQGTQDLGFRAEIPILFTIKGDR
jgi:hypothetical protein